MRRVLTLFLVVATCACGGRGAPSAHPRDASVGRDVGSRRPPSSDLALRRLWGLAPDDVWAVGDHGLVVHFDGRAWRKVPSGTTADLVGMAGRERNEAWIVGKNGTLLHLTGTTCSSENLRTDAGDSAVPGNADLLDIWVAADGTVWVAGGSGGENPIAVLGRREAGRWLFDHDDGQPLTAVWGREPDDVWARSDDSVIHWNGRYLLAHPREKLPNRRGRHGFAGGWTLVDDQALTHPTHPSPPADADQKHARRVRDFWAFGPDDVWAAVRTGLLHFDGRAWTEVSPESF